MILPTSVRPYALIAKIESAGTTSAAIGTSTQLTMSAIATSVQPARESSGVRSGMATLGVGSGSVAVGAFMERSPACAIGSSLCARRSCSRLGRPALERKQALRPPLDEQHDQHEDRDLREHGAGERLEELVHDAETERADDRAGELADAAQHHRHERVDDVALPEVGTDIAYLRQRDTAKTRHAGAQAERERIDARR